MGTNKMDEDEYKPDSNNYSRMAKCAECGKEFFIPCVSYWTYRKPAWRATHEKTVYFCGWNCMRKWEREQEEKRRAKRLEKKPPIKRKPKI